MVLDAVDDDYGYGDNGDKLAGSVAGDGRVC